jgi:tellurite resistance protein TerC
MTEIVRWVGFHILIALLILLDLGFLQRRKQKFGIKRAVAWSLGWIALSLAFNGLVYLVDGPEAALQFFAGYILEKSLSVDNIFIFILIFSYFQVPVRQQHTALYWGVIGALIMRLSFILAGVAIIEHHPWVMYLFGLFVIGSGLRFMLKKEKRVDPEKNLLVRGFRKLFEVSPKFEGDKLFVQRKGKWIATPLILVILVVESVDIVFALDSIPAIFAVTNKPFIIYTSNVFAVLGLRSLHFLLTHFMAMFRYLKVGLGAVLIFVGLKMLLGKIYPIPLTASLGIIIATLALSMLFSIKKSR